MNIPHAQNNTILPQHSASVTSLDYTFLNKLSANIIMASLLKSLKIIDWSSPVYQPRGIK